MTKQSYLYAGSWGFRGSDHGICAYRYDAETGDLEFIEKVHPEISAGIILVDRERDVLYCTDERDTYPGLQSGGGGQVYAFQINPETGRLTKLSRQPSFAPCPTYLALDEKRNYLLLTNHSGNTPITKAVKDAFGKYHVTLEYDDASTVLYPIENTGAIGDAVDIYRHSGQGAMPTQMNPHLHCVKRAPGKNLFAVTDKGADSVYMFTIDEARNKLVMVNGNGVKAAPGSAPRYCAFHPTLPMLYVNHESKHDVSTYQYGADGSLTLVETINIFPTSGFGSEDAALKTEQSDFCIDASGQYVYGLIRGINAVYTLKVDPVSGKVEKIQDLALEGDGPRAFHLSPDGKFLYVAMMRTGNIVVYAVGKDGMLSYSGKTFAQFSPGCFDFYVK